MICGMCKKETDTRTSVKGEPGLRLCMDCYYKYHNDKIEKNLQSVERAEHFREWDMSDMSDAFWMHLGKYKNNPNKRSLAIIKAAWYWAIHADHGLGNSFSHALDWCGIDLFTESERTDLPEE